MAQYLRDESQVALRNWIGGKFLTRHVLFDRYVLYENSADFQFGCTSGSAGVGSGSFDLRPATRTATTVAPWYAIDRTLRSPEWIGSGVTDSNYTDANMGTPTPAPAFSSGMGTGTTYDSDGDLEALLGTGMDAIPSTIAWTSPYLDTLEAPQFSGLPFPLRLEKWDAYQAQIRTKAGGTAANLGLYLGFEGATDELSRWGCTAGGRADHIEIRGTGTETRLTQYGLLASAPDQDSRGTGVLRSFVWGSSAINGTGGRIDVPPSAIGSDSGWVSVWMSEDSAAAARLTLFRKQGSGAGAGGDMLAQLVGPALAKAGTIQFAASGSGTAGTLSVAIGTWTGWRNLILGWGSFGKRVYVNGTLAGSHATVGYPVGNGSTYLCEAYAGGFPGGGNCIYVDDLISHTAWDWADDGEIRRFVSAGSALYQMRSGSSQAAAAAASLVTVQSSFPLYEVDQDVLGTAAYGNRYWNMRATIRNSLGTAPIDAVVNAGWIGKVQLHWGYLLGSRLVRKAGRIERSLEQESSAGFVPGASVQLELNDEFETFNPNKRDSIVNNSRLLDAPMRISVGIPNPSGTGTQWLPMGRYYVDDWSKSDDDPYLQLSCSDIWRSLSDKRLDTGYSTLSGSMTAAQTTAPLNANPNTVGFANSGTARIEDEFVSYTGTTGTGLTGLGRGVHNSTAAVHLQGNAVSQAYVNVGLDSLMKSITDAAGLGSGEVVVSSTTRPETYFESSRRYIHAANNSVTNANMVGDNGSYGLIGMVLSQQGVVSQYESVGAPRSLSGGSAFSRVTYARPDSYSGILNFDFRGTGTSFCAWDAYTADPSFLFSDTSRLAPLSTTDSMATLLWAGTSSGAAQSARHQAPQMASRNIAPRAGWAYYYSGIVPDGSGNFSVGYAITHNGRVTNTAEAAYDSTIEAGQSGPAAVLYDADPLVDPATPAGHVYVAWRKSASIKVDRYALKSDGSLDFTTKTAAMAANASYGRATALERIAAEENPLGNGLARYVLACQRLSDSAYVLLLLNSSFAILEVVSTSSTLNGLALWRSAGSPDRTRLASFFGGPSSGYSGEQTQFGLVAAFDMLFQHAQVRLTTDTIQPASADPLVYRNGALWTSGTANDYRLDRGGNYTKISFEHLLTVSDLITSTYEFRYSVIAADFGGMNAADAIRRAAAVNASWVYVDENERLVVRPRVPNQRPSFVLMNDRKSGQVDSKPGAKTPSYPNVLSLKVRQGKDMLKNRMTLKYSATADGEVNAVITVDETALAFFAGTTPTTQQLYGLREISDAENRWINNETDAQVMCTQYLSYYTIRADFEGQALFRPDLQVMDSGFIYDALLRIGVGSTSQAVRPQVQIVSVGHDLDSWKTSFKARES